MPQLLEKISSSLIPRSTRASMRTAGMPQIPKPPQAMAAPVGMSATAGRSDDDLVHVALRSVQLRQLRQHRLRYRVGGDLGEEKVARGRARGFGPPVLLR